MQTKFLTQMANACPQRIWDFLACYVLLSIIPRNMKIWEWLHYDIPSFAEIWRFKMASVRFNDSFTWLIMMVHFRTTAQMLCRAFCRRFDLNSSNDSSWSGCIIGRFKWRPFLHEVSFINCDSNCSFSRTGFFKQIFSCTSHSGPDERIFSERSTHGQRVNRSASDGFISASLSQSNSQFQLNNDPNCRLSVQSLQPVSHGRSSSRNSVDHGSGTQLAIHPNELKSSLQELQTKIQAQVCL